MGWWWWGVRFSHAPTPQQHSQLAILASPLPPPGVPATGNLWVVPGSHTSERAARLSGSLPPGALHSDTWRRDEEYSRGGDSIPRGVYTRGTEYNTNNVGGSSQPRSATAGNDLHAPPNDLYLDHGRRGPIAGPPSPAAAAVPIQTCTPGAAIVFDKDLVHAGGPNLTGQIRYALYFRLRWQVGKPRG